LNGIAAAECISSCSLLLLLLSALVPAAVGDLEKFNP
jgi:hypothetical protein